MERDENGRDGLPGGEHPPWILVVDDDESIREALQQLLELEGYPARTAESGPEALAMLRSGGAGLVLLDLMMPVMNGWEVLDAMRADRDLASIPVVVVTAFGRNLERLAELEVLRKPMEIDQLLEVVGRYCGAGQ